MEGAQGFWLDPDWGDYPYVTSSHTGTAAAIQNGISPRSIRNVWGVIKAYETYVGKRDFQPNDEVFDRIQQAGAEFGATTGEVGAWGTTERRIHGERHFRSHMQDEFSRRLGIEKIYFSDNPENINEENPLTTAA
jgi:hypothetical protein